MEQFVLVPASVYNNKCLITWTVTELEFPKYQVEQNPTYQILSLAKEKNKKQLPKKFFQPKNLVLSSYQALQFSDFFIG